MKETRCAPSSACIGSLNKKMVCFQCVGKLCGPVLKLVTLLSSFCLRPGPTLARRCGGGFPPTGQTSASVTSPSFVTLTGTSGGTGSPVVVKNVSKYNTNARILVRFAVVETRVNGEEKSSWRDVTFLRWMSFRRKGWLAIASGATMSTMASL